MDEYCANFYKSWNYPYNIKQQISSLKAILNSDNPFYSLCNDPSIQSFTFPLEDINMDELKKEILYLLDNSLLHKTTANTPDNKSKKWYRYHIYNIPNYYKVDTNRHNFDGDLEYLYDTNLTPHLYYLIEKYHNKKAPFFVSLIEPSGFIYPHKDIVLPSANNLSKVRIPIQYEPDCKMIVKNHGFLDYYNQEIVLFNHRIEHGVFNLSKMNKIDLSITLTQTDENYHCLNTFVKNKITHMLIT